MSWEVVESGIRGGTVGKSGSTTAVSGAAATGAGAAGAAAAGFDFLPFFLAFLPPMAPPPRMQQQHKPRRRNHCQSCSWEPYEPEAVEPELSELVIPLLELPALSESTLEPVFKESSELEEPAGPEPRDFNEADESPELEDNDESKAVIVVVISVTFWHATACKRASTRTARIIAA